jgi:pyruvate/2-oxoglutarate dehydrogenase complex dihydrolipoamide acyltransferase (E2) component
MSEVLLPEELWDDDAHCSISFWLYADGAQIKQGAVLAEILAQKTTLELLAPSSGVLRIRVAPEVEVRKGQVVAVIE